MKASQKFPRRRFLQGLAVTPVVLSTGGLAKAAEAEQSAGDFANRRVPVLQNFTDETSAIVTVLGTAGWSFDPAEGSNITVTQTNARALANSNRVLYELKIEGLAPKVPSQFTISNKKKNVIETRTLMGLDLSMRKPRISVMSCANYRKINDQDSIYSKIKGQKTDLILFIGDIVYSNSQIGSIFKDPEPPESALERYVETWDLVDLYQQEPLVPTLAVWDDHDYGQNNGNSSHPYREAMKEIFRAFYPIPEAHDRMSTGPGVAFRLSAFGIDLHMLDGRTFLGGGSQWGSEQEQWFFDEYKTSPNPAWILNGIQFLTYSMISENVQGKAPESLRSLTELIRETKKPTVLFSGDVHASQIQEIEPEIFGYQTYEITSSAVHSHAAGRWLRRDVEAGQIQYYGERNFLVIRPEVSPKSLSMTVRCATEFDVYDWGTLTVRP